MNAKQFKRRKMQHWEDLDRWEQVLEDADNSILVTVTADCRDDCKLIVAEIEHALNKYGLNDIE